MSEKLTSTHRNPVLPLMTTCNLDLLQCSSSTYLKAFYKRDCKYCLHFLKRGLNMEGSTQGHTESTGRDRN